MLHLDFIKLPGSFDTLVEGLHGIPGDDRDDLFVPGLNDIHNKMESEGQGRLREKLPEFVPLGNPEPGLLEHFVIVGCPDGFLSGHAHGNALDATAVSGKKVSFNHSR